MKRIITILLVLVILSLSACQTVAPNPITLNPTESTKPEPVTSEPTTDQTTEPDTEPIPGPGPVVIDTSFNDGFQKVIEAYMGDNLKNYMISPISFQYALGMLVAGADGDTKAQLLNALGMTDKEFEEYIKSFNSFVEWFDAKKAHDIEEYNKLSEERKAYETKPAGELRVADSVWKREDLAEFLQDYRLRLEMYDAQHFSFTREDIVQRANSWANEKTNGMIPKILPDDYDTENLSVLLMNALYYKNGWAYKFYDTAKTDFTTFSGKKVDKIFMASTERYKYYKDDDTELVVVPMQDNVFMTFVLGNTDNLEQKIAKSEYKMVCVTLPKFEIESSFNNGELVRFLKDRGATDVFDKEKADLSLMIDPAMLKYNLYTDDIVQKTKIKLDETGVEATAVTAIMVYGGTGVVQPEQITYFTADKPFHFFIHSCSLPTCGNTTEGELMQPQFILFEGMLVE